jgi:MinD superfamily P-loop ATPase
MRQILFLSGKGGTGKTSLAGAFAVLLKNKVLADCDVDAANLHLLLATTPVQQGLYEGSKEATIDPELCIHCRKCVQACRFHAITEDLRVDPLLCEGCGVCQTICPAEAVTLHPRVSGEWAVAETPVGPLVTAELLPGEEASGKLVTEVKKRALDVAKERGTRKVVIDGSPGIGCPVIASASGVDLAILVTEPSTSGLHDLGRILEVARHFNIEAGLVINKYDLSLELTRKIERFAEVNEVPLLGRIPYDPLVPEAMVEGRSVVENPKSPAGITMREIALRVLVEWKTISRSKGPKP